MSSLVSTGSQEIVNWVTTADGCVHTDDRTNCRQLAANSCTHRRRRRDKTVSSRRRRRCVLGISLNSCWFKDRLLYGSFVRYRSVVAGMLLLGTGGTVGLTSAQELLTEN